MIMLLDDHGLWVLTKIYYMHMYIWSVIDTCNEVPKKKKSRSISNSSKL